MCNGLHKRLEGTPHPATPMWCSETVNEKLKVIIHIALFPWWFSFLNNFTFNIEFLLHDIIWERKGERKYCLLYFVHCCSSNTWIIIPILWMDQVRLTEVSEKSQCLWTSPLNQQDTKMSATHALRFSTVQGRLFPDVKLSRYPIKPYACWPTLMYVLKKKK